MAIEIFDKGICIAAFFVRFDPDTGDDGTLFLSGRGVSTIVAEGAGTCIVTLDEELPPIITTLDPAVDPVHLEIVAGVMNKNAPVLGPASLITFTQESANRIRIQGFSGPDNTPNHQSFWAFVFRLPMPAVASSAIPPPV